MDMWVLIASRPGSAKEARLGHKAIVTAQREVLV